MKSVACSSEADARERWREANVSRGFSLSMTRSVELMQ